ncbi:response regulator transcription factor [Variovorax sp. HJSM1_2]
MNTEKSAPLVIVVDDDIDMRNALQQLLEAYGFECIALPDGESLTSMSVEQKTYCVVIDIFLPGCTGIEAYRQMHDKGQFFPVIFITAHDESKSRQSVTAFGAELLLKPFTGRDLIAAIYRAAGPRQSESA